MSGLNEHFASSGYTIHRISLSSGALPECCRESEPMGTAIRYPGGSAGDSLLPLVKCRLCGRMYAIVKSDGVRERFLPVENPLRYDIVQLG